MTTALAAFPADGYTARWRRWEHDADETLTLRWENEGWVATGEVGREAVTYVLRLSPTWQIRQFLLFRDLADPDLWLGTDGGGRWGEVNGAHRTDLDGCTDIDLGCTPFTNTLPIRRMQLDVGDAVDVKTAIIDVETLEITPTRQRYHHVAPRRYEYTNLDSGFSTQFDVDEFGLVRDYPDLFRRT